MAIFLIGGSFSNLFYGYLSDKLEPKNIRAKAYISAIQGLIGAACYFLVYFFNISFWFAVAFVILESFFAEGIIAPSISMMTSTAPRGQEENVMGLY
jgi:MFS family permease